MTFSPLFTPCLVATKSAASGPFVGGRPGPANLHWELKASAALASAGGLSGWLETGSPDPLKPWISGGLVDESCVFCILVVLQSARPVWACVDNIENRRSSSGPFLIYVLDRLTAVGTPRQGTLKAMHAHSKMHAKARHAHAKMPSPPAPPPSPPAPPSPPGPPNGGPR